MFIELWDKNNTVPPQRLELPSDIDIPPGIVIKDGIGYARKANQPLFELHELPLWIVPPDDEDKK